PPRINLREPVQESGILKLIARHVRILEHHVHVVRRKAFVIVLNTPDARDPLRKERIVRGDANSAAFQIKRECGIGRKRQRGRCEFQSVQNVLLEGEAAVKGWVRGHTLNGSAAAGSDKKTFTIVGSNSMPAHSIRYFFALASGYSARNGRAERKAP